MKTTLQIVHDKALDLWTRKHLLQEQIAVSAGPLTVQEAVGTPERSDFPIQKGREKLMEAVFRGERGQAFTDHYGNYCGTLAEVASLPLDSNLNRAVFVATLNAVCRVLGLCSGTIHCRDKGPTNCSGQIANHVRARYNAERITLIGLQPALAEALGKTFALRIIDLDPANVGQPKGGVLVEDGHATQDAIAWCDVLLVTGTTLANNSIDMFLTEKPVLFYGTTISGAAALMGWERFCPESEPKI